jgi:hypothetical protein
VDYFLVSVRDERIRDFVGIELQTLDTTGSVWPERQHLLEELGLPRAPESEESARSYGMNWMMTAKTILVQMHHKIETFEHVNKKLVLVTQDTLLAYMTGKFKFGHLSNPPKLGDSMHFHAYDMEQRQDNSFRLKLDSRLSTDAEGIARCLDRKAEGRVELEQILLALQAKISAATLFTPV